MSINPLNCRSARLRTMVLAGMMAGGLLFVPPAPGFAESRPPSLGKGMDYASVVKAWGAPSEREEHETARNDVWIYDFGRVAFHEGRVTSWSLKEPGAFRGAHLQERPTVQSKGPSQGDPQLVEEILAEIMKEAPQGDEKPNPGIGVPPAPGMVLPNNVPPPPAAVP